MKYGSEPSRHVAVVRHDGVYDICVFFIFLRKFGADLDMRTFLFLIHRFADIV